MWEIWIILIKRLTMYNAGLLYTNDLNEQDSLPLTLRSILVLDETKFGWGGGRVTWTMVAPSPPLSSPLDRMTWTRVPPPPDRMTWTRVHLHGQGMIWTTVPSPLSCEQTKHEWKHYLPRTTYVVGYNSVSWTIVTNLHRKLQPTL